MSCPYAGGNPGIAVDCFYGTHHARTTGFRPWLGRRHSKWQLGIDRGPRLRWGMADFVPSAPRASHVIILGCGRSGTSIFGELFEHLEPYAYWSEPKYGDLWGLDWRRPVAIKVPEEDPDYASTPGLSFPLEHLLANLPEPRRFFWQVRHPLDAICSLRVGIANNWGHHPKPPDWRDWLERPLLERCAHHWNYLNTVGYAAVRDLARPTRFEDFVALPREFAEEICREVGLAPEDHGEALEGWASRVQNTNNAKFVEAKTSRGYSRPDHSRRIERWRENLTTEEVARLTPMVAETARGFGYELG
jgi:hypothetical protein